MSVVSVNPRSFILALFIRDDGERFLLGDKGYDFKDSQLHFAANTIENDEVMKQGADGVMVAGQVRRASVQSFDGFVGDATMAKETIEQMRRDFFAFFVKGHHFRVIYVDYNRNAWQRKGGYLVDAPEVKELWQIHPEYHVGLNFEDVNYYSYDEDADGEEILSNLVDVPVSTAASGGLVWDEDGAVSEDAEVEYISETAVATPAKNVYITDAAEAPLASFQLDGETSQNGTPTPDAPVPVQTVTGENVVKICGKNLFDKDSITTGFYLDSTGAQVPNAQWVISDFIPVESGQKYTISGVRISGQAPKMCYYDSSKAFVSSVDNGNSTVTIPIGVSYLRKCVYIGNWQLSDLPTTQIELGSTATTYEPYQGQSYEVNLGNIELCKIGDYQDYIWNDNGTWKIFKAIQKVTIDGTATWTKSQFGNNNYQHNVSPTPPSESGGSGSKITVISDAFVGVSYNDRTVSTSNITYTTYGNIWIRNNSFDTATDVVNYFSEHPTNFYYVKIEGQQSSTAITNETLIGQLEAVLGGHTYAGTNNITTITPNEQGTLEIRYYTKYQPMVVSGGYVWEAGGAGGATIVVNNSIDNVNPIWKIYGPTMNPQLENSTTGETIEYVGMIAEGQTLTIDMGEQTASLDGLNVISNLVGDFISLAPGVNRLIYSVLGDAGASSIGWSEIVG